MKVTGKIIRTSLILSAFLFVSVTTITMEYKSPTDGNDLVGWPFKFYEFSGGKMRDSFGHEIDDSERISYNFLYLILDFVLAFMISALTMLSLKTLRKKIFR